MSRNDILDKAVKAALELAATQRWSDLTLSKIAETAGLTLADFHGVASREDISAAVEGRFDAAMSEGSFAEDETPRTRLFDVIMMRFEAMEDVRDGTMSYLRWRDSSLGGLSLRVRNRAASARWALACTGLDKGKALNSGVLLTGLAWALARAERAWRQETSPDLTRTMAALDAELIKLEDRINWIKGRGKREAPASADQPAD